MGNQKNFEGMMILEKLLAQFVKTGSKGPSELPRSKFSSNSIGCCSPYELICFTSRRGRSARPRLMGCRPLPLRYPQQRAVFRA